MSITVFKVTSFQTKLTMTRGGTRSSEDRVIKETSQVDGQDMERNKQNSDQ